MGRSREATGYRPKGLKYTGYCGKFKKIHQTEAMELMLRGHVGVTAWRTLKHQLNHRDFILRTFRRLGSSMKARVV